MGQFGAKEGPRDGNRLRSYSLEARAVGALLFHYKYEPGGDELRAVEWSLSPRGANSETGQGLWPVLLRDRNRKWSRPVTADRDHARGASKPFVHPYYSTGARWAQPGEPRLLLKGGDAERRFPFSIDNSLELKKGEKK